MRSIDIVKIALILTQHFWLPDSPDQDVFQEIVRVFSSSTRLLEVPKLSQLIRAQVSFSVLHQCIDW